MIADVQAPAPSGRPDPTSDAEVLKRYQRFMADAKPEHDKLVQQAADFYAAYGLHSIQGQDFADLEKVWGNAPPEIGMMLSNVNTFWGSLVSSRREPSFPGFDGSPADAVIGEMLNLLIRAGRRWGGSDAVDEQALTDLIITGYSFTEQYLETTGRPPFRTKERWISLSDIYWDKGANLKNLIDSQEFARRHHYSVDEAAARFHDHADEIRAMGVNLGGADSASAPGEGARALGGPAVSVSVTPADGRSGGTTSTRRLREIPVDDFQFTVWEELVAFDDPQAGRVEEKAYLFAAKVAAAQAAAAEQGALYEPPAALPYAEATWYRAKILTQSPAGSPRILEAAKPIPGNRRLVRPMTAFPEEYLDGDMLRTRYFGFGRVLLGLQRLVSVAIRIYIEQEARRNRSGGDVEEGAFDSAAARQAWVDSRAIPGGWGVVKDGAYDKIHPSTDTPTPHVSSMKDIFRFLSVDLVSHMLGISDMSRGTFEGDRSAKFVATMQESATQMQSRITSAFTDYLAEGSVTMCKLLLDALDGKDIDRLVGQQPLREGITGQKDPQTQELTPIMIPDSATGQQIPLTTGTYLKINAGEIFDHDVSFGLRPSAPSERMANAMLSMQHGWLKEVADLLPPGAGKILAPAALKASFAEGTDFADAAVKIQAFIAQQEEQEKAQAEAATEQGWLAFIQGLASTDFEKAASLMQQASSAVTGPQQQGGGQPQVQ